MQAFAALLLICSMFNAALTSVAKQRAELTAVTATL